jgi:hypothetical protein
MQISYSDSDNDNEDDDDDDDKSNNNISNNSIFNNTAMTYALTTIKVVLDRHKKFNFPALLSLSTFFDFDRSISANNITC